MKLGFSGCAGGPRRSAAAYASAMTRRTLALFPLALLLLAPLHAAPPAAPAPTAPVAPARAKAQPGKYLALSDVDYVALLPDPPKVGSPYARGELELVLAMQKQATPADIERANSEDKMTPRIFADVLGESFSEEKFPATFAWLNQAAVDSREVTEAAKAHWARPRPCDLDKRIQAKVGKPKYEAYPSGHSTRAIMWADLLSEIYPEQAEALRARARVAGMDRILAGLHYPSDVSAGFALGEALAIKMKANPACQEDLAAARGEKK